MKNNSKISLFIHIGTHKTGSTAIQNFLNHNREILLKKGIGYFNSDDSRNAHHNLAFALNAQNHSIINQYLESIEQFSVDKEVSKIILSSEEFESIRDHKKLAPLLRFDLTILCYLRRQDYYLEAEYNQLVRQPSRRYAYSIYKFVLEQNYDLRFNYKNLYETWMKLAPLSSINFMPFPETVRSLDLFKNLIDKIGIDWNDELRLPLISESNISLSPKAIIYLAQFNKKEVSNSDHHKLIKILGENFPKDGVNRLLSTREAKNFLKRYKKSNEFIEKKFSFKFDENLTVESHIDFEEDFDRAIARKIYSQVAVNNESDNNRPYYVIAMEESSKRYNNFIKNQYVGGFKVVSGVDGSKLPISLSTLMAATFIKKALKFKSETWIKGTLGCFFSHISAIETFLQSSSEYGLIVEDDAMFMHPIDPVFDIVAESDFDLVFLNERINTNKPYSKSSDFITTLDNVDSIGTGAEAYILSRKCAVSIVEAFKKSLKFGMPTGFDGFIQSHVKSLSNYTSTSKIGLKSLEKWQDFVDCTLLIGALTEPIVTHNDNGFSYINEHSI
jgi:GR25 family glycosyltransferase involved in LPS biosynthesis